MAIQDDWAIDANAYTLTYVGGFDGDGVPNNKYTVNALYSWLMNEFDEPGRMDEPIPMSPQTPVEYTVLWPWYIDDESIKALFEGAIQSSSWERVVATDPGLVWVEYSTTDPVSSDIGLPIVHETDNDAGVLVGYDDVRKILVIRPDSSAAGDNFDSVSGNLDVTGGTQDIVQAEAAVTGESVWACIYTLGALQDETEIYIYQVDDFLEVTTPSYTKLTPWWFEDINFSSATGVELGHVDLLIKIQEVGNVVDEGRLLVLARQYSKTFSHYEVTVTGGRTPIPLGNLDDLDNESGYLQLLTDADTGTWDSNDIGEVFRLDGAGNERQTAIMTSIAGTSPNFTIQYYLIGKGSDFANNDVLENEGETKTLTVAGTPTSVNPAAEVITVDFGATTGDIDEDGSDEHYSVTLDCKNQTFDEVYEWLKFATRHYETSDIDESGSVVVGEAYRGIGSYYIPFDGATNDPPFTDDELITWSGGSGYLRTTHDRGTNEGFIIVYRLRGSTPADGVTMTGGSSGHDADVDLDGGADPIEAVTEVPQSTFGTYAGGKMFFARGVLPININSNDVSSYQAIDSEGNVVNPPLKVTVEITGLTSGDRGAMYEVLASGSALLVRDQHGLAAGNNELDATLVVDSTIPADTPGKSTGGVVVAVDVSDASESRETRYRYTGWASITFTLAAGATSTCEAGGSSTVLNDTGIGAGDIEVGDRIHNVTDDSYATVVEVNADDLLTTPLTGGTLDVWTLGDTYQNNTLDRNYDGASDEAYVPILDEVAASDTISNTLEYLADINVMVRVRFASGASPILPFQQTGLAVLSTGRSVAAIRNPDTIKT